MIVLPNGKCLIKLGWSIWDYPLWVEFDNENLEESKKKIADGFQEFLGCKTRDNSRKTRENKK
jgi:hypothetical protein